jgi:hypothetical protein
MKTPSAFLTPAIDALGIQVFWADPPGREDEA